MDRRIELGNLSRTSPRILITRLSHIGDCVLTLPLACAIKRHWPESHLAWAMESPTTGLLENHPCIDEIVPVRKKWLKHPRSWMSLRRRLRRTNADIVMDPQCLTKSAMLGWLSGAPHRIGFAGRHGRELSQLCNNVRVQPTESHLVDRTLELLGPLVDTDLDRRVEFRFPVSSRDVSMVEGFRFDEGIARFLVINPGASWPSKRWINRRFGFVARYAWQVFRIRSVVTWAGSDERKMAEEIVGESNGCAVMAPRTKLGEFAALALSAEVFIGCDTGPLHIAAAVGTRCIGLYGPTLPAHSGAYGAGHIAVQRFHQTAGNRKKVSNDAMRQITVDEVCAALDRLFDSTTRAFAA